MPTVKSLTIDPAYTITILGDGGNPWDIIVPSGTVIARETILIGSQASGGAFFVADESCFDGGGNTGWTFIEPGINMLNYTGGGAIMEIITPVVIKDTQFLGSSILEDDYPAWDPDTTYAADARVIVSGPSVHKKYLSLAGSNTGNYPPDDTESTNWVELGSTRRWAAFDKNTTAASTGSITADLLDDACTSLTGWTDNDTGNGVSSVVSGAFQFNAGTAAVGSAARRDKLISSPPDQFTIEIGLEHDALGTIAQKSEFILGFTSATWIFYAAFASDGLFIQSNLLAAPVEVGTNLVVVTGAQQRWRFEVDKTIETQATVKVYLDDVYQGQEACGYTLEEGFYNDGKVTLWQRGETIANATSRVNYLEIGTGHGNIESVSEMTHIIVPGSVDSCAILELASTAVDVYMADLSTNLMPNGESWSGASGATQPTGWDKIGSPTFAVTLLWIYTCAMTSAGAGDGISDDITVEAGTTYQIIGHHYSDNEAIPQYSIYDNSNSADVIALTDLPANSQPTLLSVIFTAPAGCTSIKFKLICKGAGETVYFRSIRMAEVVYRHTEGTGSAINRLVLDDLPNTYPAAALTVSIVNGSGVASCGEILAGTLHTIGSTLYSPEVGITDYSTVTTSAYGVTSIVKRNYHKRLTCRVLIDNANFDAIHQLIADNRSTPMLWIVADNYDAMVIYGIYRDHRILANSPLYSTIDVDIQGVSLSI